MSRLGSAIILLVLVFPLVAQGRPLTVFAASSLQGPLDRVLAQWKNATGQEAIPVYAGTSALARQIEQGAPADLFIAADEQWMDYLQTRGLLAESRRRQWLTNELVLIVPAASSVRTIDLSPPLDLRPWLGTGRLALAETATVPAGRYAKAALQRLGAWQSVAGLLTESDNVRAALVYVARAEAPLGIVYRSDALAEPKVRIAAVFPADSHPPIVYPVARVAASNNLQADVLLDFLFKPESVRVFVDAGFAVAK